MMKEKVLQLHSWIKRELTSGKKADEVQGVYVINHFREIDPRFRNHPHSDHAKELMKLYRFKLLTTPNLFDIIKDVKGGKLLKPDASKKVWECDKVD